MYMHRHEKRPVAKQCWPKICWTPRDQFPTRRLPCVVGIWELSLFSRWVIWWSWVHFPSSCLHCDFIWLNGNLAASWQIHYLFFHELTFVSMQPVNQSEIVTIVSQQTPCPSTSISFYMTHWSRFSLVSDLPNKGAKRMVLLSLEREAGV